MHHCGTDYDTLHLERKDTAPVDDQEKALAFCAYTQPSTVARGGGGLPLNLSSPENQMKRHVGVFINLCGHAGNKYHYLIAFCIALCYLTNSLHSLINSVHSHCCESYLKTVRDDRFIDRMEGGKRKEFRCPLCQRLSNCLVPFIDVAVDWIDLPVDNKKTQETTTSEMPSDKAAMVVDFLSSTKWWCSRNDKPMKWDGDCSFSLQKKMTSNCHLCIS